MYTTAKKRECVCEVYVSERVREREGGGRERQRGGEREREREREKECIFSECAVQSDYSTGVCVLECMVARHKIVTCTVCMYIIRALS